MERAIILAASAIGAGLAMIAGVALILLFANPLIGLL